MLYRIANCNLLRVFRLRQGNLHRIQGSVGNSLKLPSLLAKHGSGIWPFLNVTHTVRVPTIMELFYRRMKDCSSSDLDLSEIPMPASVSLEVSKLLCGLKKACRSLRLRTLPEALWA